jgi:nucleotide-binding universal stress UspA family protein
MDDVKRILVVSRMTKYCARAVRYGVSLARQYGAELHILHVFYDPFVLGGWNMPYPSIEDAYRKSLEDAKKELDKIVYHEVKKGITVKEEVKGGKPTREILDYVKEQNIDLMILLSHGEWRLEHFLFGRSNEEIIRKMPCSVLMVKQEPGEVPFED